MNELMGSGGRKPPSQDDINEMVLNLVIDMREMKKGVNAIKEIANRANRGVKDIEEEYPLLPPEADDLSKAVQRKGVEIMGGKKSNAYNNKDLRRRVYQDIYMEIKRQYGLINDFGRQMSYKKLKRKYLQGAFAVVDMYDAPIAIANEIESENDMDGLYDD